MIDEHYIELMNDEIDRRNTPEESDTLRSFLKSHPEARQFFTELEKSTQLLAESEEIEHPADMPQRIMDLIAEGDARRKKTGRWKAPEARSGTGERARRRRFGSFLRPAPAWAFAAGLVLGIFAFNAADLLWRTAPSPEQVRGDLSILLRNGDELRGSPWPVEGAGFAGTISVHRHEGGLVVRIRGEARPDTRFVLKHEDGLSGVSYRTLAGSSPTLTTASGRTTLTFAGTGDHVLDLMSDDLAATALTLHIESEGERQEHVFGPSPP